MATHMITYHIWNRITCRWVEVTTTMAKYLATPKAVGTATCVIVAGGLLAIGLIGMPPTPAPYLEGPPTYNTPAEYGVYAPDVIYEAPQYPGFINNAGALAPTGSGDLFDYPWLNWFGEPKVVTIGTPTHNVQVVSEPSTWIVFGTAILWLVYITRKKA